MPILTKENKLEDIIECVACPFNALKVDGNQCVCTYPTKVFKNNLGPVNLGNTRDDILQHCGSCKFKDEFGKKDDKKKVDEVKTKKIEMNSFGQVACPSSKADVFVVEDCKTCPFFGKKKMKELKESMGADAEINFIHCHYPVVPRENLGAWLDDKTKKDVKKAIKEKTMLI